MKSATTVERSRFAFDLGTNSIGWAVYRLDAQNRPCELVDCGVRIIDSSNSAAGRTADGTSKAAERRTPRAARRRRDRFIQRRDGLMTLLIRYGLMPQDEAARKALEGLDPYAIRGRALKERLEPHEIGRALFHLNQRRGFKSNRVADAKRDKTEEKDAGLISAGGSNLKAKLAEEGYETLGEFYAARQAAGKVRDRLAVRVRPTGSGKEKGYDFYPQRDMVEHEFDRIWEVQSVHHPDLMTEEVRLALKGEAVVSVDAWERMTEEERKMARGALFYQRPLKAPVIGRCTFPPHEETRLSAAHPVAQRFRIYQELANIRIVEGLERPRSLTREERDRLDIVEGTDGLWRGHAATVFEVNQRGFIPAWTADYDAKLIMRLHKGDTVELEDGGERRVKRVVRISPSNNIVYLAGHDEGGDLPKRHDDKEDPFRWDFANIGKLKARGCRLVRVNEAGKIVAA